MVFVLSGGELDIDLLGHAWSDDALLIEVDFELGSGGRQDVDTLGVVRAVQHFYFLDNGAARFEAGELHDLRNCREETVRSNRRVAVCL